MRENMRHSYATPARNGWDALASRLLGQVLWGHVLFDYIMLKLFEGD